MVAASPSVTLGRDGEQYLQLVVASSQSWLRGARPLAPDRPVLPPAAAPTAATTVADHRLIEHLADVYALQDGLKVRAFLRRHPYLVPLLIDARQMISRHFGDEALVTLEVVQDPESEDDPELVAQIHTSAGSSEALHALQRFDEEWWLGALDRARCKLTIGIRHV